MRVEQSPLKTKKWRATFKDGTHTDFGDPKYEDYTQHKDEKRRELYRNRHKANENWNDPKSAGALSRFLLWGDSTSLATNLADYKKRFAGKL